MHEIVLDAEWRLHVPHRHDELDACKALEAMGGDKLRCAVVLNAWRDMDRAHEYLLPATMRDAYRVAVATKDARNTRSRVYWSDAWGVPFPLHDVLALPGATGELRRIHTESVRSWAVASANTALQRVATALWAPTDATPVQYEAKVTDTLPPGVGNSRSWRCGRETDKVCLCINSDWYKRVYLTGLSVIGDALVVDHVGTLDGSKILRAVTRLSSTVYADQTYVLRDSVLVRIGDQRAPTKMREIPSYY
jgi:hypothetical protein